MKKKENKNNMVQVHNSNIRISIPRHCSSLNELWLLPKQVIQTVEQQRLQQTVFVAVIQCHREGFWNLFPPLFFPHTQEIHNDKSDRPDDDDSEIVMTMSAASSTVFDTSRMAANILIQHFQGCFQRLMLCNNKSETATATETETATEIDNESVSNSNESPDIPIDSEDPKKLKSIPKLNWDHSLICPSRSCLIPSEKCSRKKEMKTRSSQNYQRNDHYHLIILPPYHTSENIPLRPERLFTSSLVQLENLQIRLQTLNAYIATLGGGYFLCRYLSTAVSLARYQRNIALALEDRNLADKCTINEAYNYIHAGKIKYALKLIRNVKVCARKRNDVLILSMCKSARWFAKEVDRASLYESDGVTRSGSNVSPSPTLVNLHIDQNLRSKLQIPKNSLSSSSSSATVARTSASIAEVSSTIDDFNRIRIVRDRCGQLM